MYKPNGEELMSPLEEMEMRERMSRKRKEASADAPAIDSLRSALYTALYGSRASDSHRELDPCGSACTRLSR